MLFSGFTTGWFMNLLYSLPAILIALSFHEFAHAWAAWRMGDPTAKNAGRLTLDPIRHLDLIGTVCIILFQFGWAKPVPINPRNFKHPKRDEILVSLAGVAMNFLISFIAFAVLAIVYKGVVGDIASTIIDYIMILNIYFGVFNLIPIPPLDGFHIISALFIKKAGQVVAALYRYGFIILFILLLTGAFSFIMKAALNGVLSVYISIFSPFLQ
ncbi:MAG: site-2 protease family protein [Eubacteriales bacterium]